MTLEYGTKDDNEYIQTIIHIRVANKKFLKAMAGINGISMKEQLDNTLTEQRKIFDKQVKQFKN